MTAQGRTDEEQVAKYDEDRQYTRDMRNCLESSGTRLERILLEQLEFLASGGNAEAHSPPFGAARNLADLRQLLRGCTASATNGDPFEDSIAYAREQFSLDDAETQILL